MAMNFIALACAQNWLGVFVYSTSKTALPALMKGSSWLHSE